jgi:hypothetical protein
MRNWSAQDISDAKTYDRQEERYPRVGMKRTEKRQREDIGFYGVWDEDLGRSWWEHSSMTTICISGAG